MNIEISSEDQNMLKNKLLRNILGEVPSSKVTANKVWDSK